MTALMNQSKKSSETAAENGIHDARPKTSWKDNPSSFFESNFSNRLFNSALISASGRESVSRLSIISLARAARSSGDNDKASSATVKFVSGMSRKYHRLSPTQGFWPGDCGSQSILHPISPGRPKSALPLRLPSPRIRPCWRVFCPLRSMESKPSRKGVGSWYRHIFSASSPCFAIPRHVAPFLGAPLPGAPESPRWAAGRGRTTKRQPITDDSDSLSHPPSPSLRRDKSDGRETG